MRSLILILLLASPVVAQQQDWKFIKEMSGEIPNHPGLTIEIYASQISRGDKVIKLVVKAEFPGGAPYDLLKANAPLDFDISSITRMLFRAEFNCDTLTMKTVNNSGEIYQFNGKKYKSKEPPFKLEQSHIFSQYFCEQGEKPSKAPTLKPKL